MECLGHLGNGQVVGGQGDAEFGALHKHKHLAVEGLGEPLRMPVETGAAAHNGLFGDGGGAERVEAFVLCGGNGGINIVQLGFASCRGGAAGFSVFRGQVAYAYKLHMWGEQGSQRGISKNNGHKKVLKLCLGQSLGEDFGAYA